MRDSTSDRRGEDDGGKGELDDGGESDGDNEVSRGIDGGLRVASQPEKGRHCPRRQTPQIEGSLLGLQVMPSGR